MAAPGLWRSGTLTGHPGWLRSALWCLGSGPGRLEGAWFRGFRGGCPVTGPAGAGGGVGSRSRAPEPPRRPPSVGTITGSLGSEEGPQAAPLTGTGLKNLRPCFRAAAICLHRRYLYPHPKQNTLVFSHDFSNLLHPIALSGPRSELRVGSPNRVRI